MLCRRSFHWRSHMSTTLAAPRTYVIHIPAEHGVLVAELTIPQAPIAVIAFARTNAAYRSSRYDHALSPALHDAGFATIAFDLLTPSAELVDAPTRGLRMDLALLAR